MLSLVLLLLLVLGLLHTEWGQNYVVGQVTKRLSKDLQTKLSINNVEIGFFNRLNLEGVMLQDRQQDTLLYAGAVTVRITDWFFLKKEAELKYLGLENAVIKLQRTDSVWNYQFLADYFAAPGSAGPKKKSGIEFDLKEIELRNVSLWQHDGWLGRDMRVRMGILKLDANEISVTRQVIDINRLEMVRPYYAQFDFDGKKPAVPDSLKVKKKDTSAMNSDNWKLAMNFITISEGTFRSDQDSLNATLPGFDGQHLVLRKINGTIENVRLSGDTLRANMDLAAKERSGFTVQKLKSSFRLHPGLMEFANLELRTNKSVLGNYYAMRYPSLASMSRFIHEVSLQVRLRNSTLHSDDLAYFAPALKGMNRRIRISGNAKGTVDDLSAEKVTAQVGNSTFFSGDISLVGLPDMASTFIDLKADQFRTTYAEATDLVPALRRVTTPNLWQLEFLRFDGSFTGFINDFVTFGTIQTALGTIVSDLNMKLPGGRPPVYSGSLSTSGFRLGRFLNDPKLGSLSFAGNVRGRGFAWRSLDANLDGNIRRIDYNGYTFQNITAKGRIANRTLDGNFIIKDPNADLRLQGLVDLSGVPVFRAKAQIEYANLRQLGLTPQDLVLKGNFDLDFKGRNLNDFIGNARISGASLLRDGQPLPFDSLNLTASIQNGVKRLRATSNELDAEINGRYDLATLPDAFTLFLNRYYPSYIKPPRRTLPPQSFSFKITTGVIEDYLKLFDPNLLGFNNSEISGLLDLDSNKLQVRADVPQAGFKQYAFSNVVLNADGNLDRLLAFGSMDNAVVSDSLNFPRTTISLTAANDISDVKINTVANQTINSAALSAQVQTFADGFKVVLKPSAFVINGKNWTADEGGELDFRKRTVVHGQVVLRESEQEIRLSTQPSDIGNWSDLAIALNKINLGDLSPLLLKQNRVEGLVSGNILVEDPQSRLNITTDLRTEGLRLDNDSLGALAAELAYNNTSGLLSGSVRGENPEQEVSADISIDLNDSANLHRDRISVNARRYPVKILERFIGTLFSDLRGTITGNLDILGEGTGRQFVGKARVSNAGLKVNFTQVFYGLEDTEIELTENEINFGTIKMRDTLGNTATMRGKIGHEGFQNMKFDIEVKTDNKPMVLLNTTYRDNQTFYGRAMGTGSFVLTGRQEDMFMNIDMIASDQDSSYITLPPSQTRQSGGAADFMVERKYGREMTAEDLRGNTTNLTYQVNLTANPLVNIEVILDELTGDIIKGRGTGTLFLSAGTTEPLNIRGRYDIQEGSYLFTFQSFFKKPFVIRPGGNNFIEWTGDPFGANIRLEAVYRAEKVSFAPLVQSQLLATNNVNLAGYRGDVNVLATLTGELFKPNFSFKLELPGNLTNIDPSISYAFQQIEKNPNELNKQVTALIVGNQFLPFEGQAGNSGGQFSELAYNTISGLLFGEVNKRLNQLLSKVLSENNISLNFSGSLYNRNLVSNSQGFNINQGDVNLSLNYALSNQFTITFGSTLNVPLQSTLQQTVQYLPDVTVEWTINEAGTIRATFFYRQNLDFFGGNSGGNSLRTTRTGASISYRKEFESLKEFLFGKRRGRLKPLASDSLPVQDSSEVKRN